MSKTYRILFLLLLFLSTCGFCFGLVFCLLPTLPILSPRLQPSLCSKWNITHNSHVCISFLIDNTLFNKWYWTSALSSTPSDGEPGTSGRAGWWWAFPLKASLQSLKVVPTSSNEHTSTNATDITKNWGNNTKKKKKVLVCNLNQMDLLCIKLS